MSCTEGNFMTRVETEDVQQEVLSSHINFSKSTQKNPHKDEGVHVSK